MFVICLQVLLHRDYKLEAETHLTPVVRVAFGGQVRARCPQRSRHGPDSPEVETGVTGP